MNHLFLISNLADGESTNYWMLIYFIPLFLFIFTIYFVINFFVFSLIKKHLDEDFKRLRNSFIISFTSLMCYPISVMVINIIAYFGHIRTLIPGTSGQHNGIIRTE